MREVNIYMHPRCSQRWKDLALSESIDGGVAETKIGRSWNGPGICFTEGLYYYYYYDDDEYDDDMIAIYYYYFYSSYMLLISVLC